MILEKEYLNIFIDFKIKFIFVVFNLYCINYLGEDIADSIVSLVVIQTYPTTPHPNEKIDGGVSKKSGKNINYNYISLIIIMFFVDILGQLLRIMQ